MKTLACTLLGFVCGFATYAWAIDMDVDDEGEIIYDTDEFSVKAGKNTKYGWSFAKVTYKNQE